MGWTARSYYDERKKEHPSSQKCRKSERYEIVKHVNECNHDIDFGSMEAVDHLDIWIEVVIEEAIWTRKLRKETVLSLISALCGAAVYLFDVF